MISIAVALLLCICLIDSGLHAFSFLIRVVFFITAAMVFDLLSNMDLLFSPTGHEGISVPIVHTDNHDASFLVSSKS